MTATRCACPTAKGGPCPMPQAYVLEDGTPACIGHAARAGHEGARAAQQARLSGKAKPKKARKLPKDPQQAMALRVAELEALAERAERKGDLTTSARFREMVVSLLLPAQRAAANIAEAAGTPLAPAAMVACPPLSQLLPRMSDSEVKCLEIGYCALVRAMQPDTALPAPERPQLCAAVDEATRTDAAAALAEIRAALPAPDSTPEEGDL